MPDNQAVMRRFVDEYQGKGDDGVADMRDSGPDRDGDKVWTRKTFKGNHRGDFMGIPPTGTEVAWDVIDIVRFRDGRIAEHWNVVDAMGLMAQLGRSAHQPADMPADLDVHLHHRSTGGGVDPSSAGGERAPERAVARVLELGLDVSGAAQLLVQ